MFIQWNTVQCTWNEAVINIWIWNDLREYYMEEARCRTMYVVCSHGGEGMWISNV